MRLPWQKSNTQQLDLLGDTPTVEDDSVAPRLQAPIAARPLKGAPATIALALIDEDPANPRAASSDIDLDDLATDIRLRGILVPLVVHPVDGNGRYLLHFGARRLRAAARAGLLEVPVVVRDAPADRYAQVAENLKRADLAPLDLARFIRKQMDAGESQTEVSRRLGPNLTTVAHHLSLLDLPPMLADALRTGRCNSPRTLHELSKIHERVPDQVQSLVDGTGNITREAVAALRAEVDSRGPSQASQLIGRAAIACDRLEKLLLRIGTPENESDRADLKALQAKVRALSSWLSPGSDGQTP